MPADQQGIVILPPFVVQLVVSSSHLSHSIYPFVAPVQVHPQIAPILADLTARSFSLLCFESSSENLRLSAKSADRSLP